MAPADWVADLALAGFVAAMLLLLVCVRPIDHDESQYVAATVLARQLVPYRDFDYLQTPLQPLLLAPLLTLIPVAPLVLLRCCNAFMAWLAALMLGRLVARITASRAWGRATVLLLLATDAFQFAASTARNDVLPFLCLCCALTLLRQLEGRKNAGAILTAGALGIVMAAGAAAKISYALPAAAIPIVEWTMPRSVRRAPLLGGYLLGAACVGTWVLLVVMRAPDRAWFDVVTFPRQAPIEWYRAMGEGFSLSFPGRALKFLLFASIGPVPVLAAAFLNGRPRTADVGPKLCFRRYCMGLLIAGIIAALLPAPLWRQYLLPLYPPLFVLGAPGLHAMWNQRRWRVAAAILTMGGLVLPLIMVGTAILDGSPLLAMERDAALVDVMLRDHQVRGPVAGIAPEYIADAGASLDPRFAAGPFLFRTQNGLGRGASVIGIDQGDAVARLRGAPPAAILTGGDAATSGSPALDAGLRQAARLSGFDRVANLSDGLALWMRPRRARRGA